MGIGSVVISHHCKSKRVSDLSIILEIIPAALESVPPPKIVDKGLE